MSQDALAVSLGMTQQAVSAIERGGGVSEENWPEIEKILKMSRVEIVTKCLSIDSSGSRGSMVNINASGSSYQHGRDAVDRLPDLGNTLTCQNQPETKE